MTRISEPWRSIVLALLLLGALWLAASAAWWVANGAQWLVR